MARIDLQDLAHSYHPNPASDADYALKPMNRVWQDGGAYALLGPSGCGKTTLLNIISGLLVPSRGKILFDGVDVSTLPTEKRNIAQVFQFPVIYDTMSVYDNLAFPLRNRKVPEKQVDARVREIAGMLDLARDLSRPATGLTADAKQKISLGRGLVRSDVAAILFDEPLTVIDPHLKWELRSKIKELHRRLPITLIYVTHDQTEALTIADQVVVMYDGGVVQSGTPEDLFERPDHTFVGKFIGSPGMNVLPCRLDGATAYIGDQAVAVPPVGTPTRGEALELGVRPEYCTLAPAGAGLPVQITRIDDLGRVRLARVTLAGQPMIATVPDGVAINGSEASVTFDPRALHLYEGGFRLQPASGGHHG
ncbi:ABC transporter ATP-binding protein [Elstera cyanobacteriorum]|uniref:ABC transporter ATP-binding protein n=1 Tax=Elstera cyanobacteriorum TaxID=2022747 RepID=UPI0023549895|nr:ABC transporter ATP-binding protein [Elstera cyanobacteriorum]MCK6443238.1 ABC transporter ATP-binding protein [Elstera cyanobacteriorum]